MIHEKFPLYFSKKDETAKRKEILAKKASRIIAVSYQTKKDIVEILGINEDKIDVIYHGSSFLDIKEDLKFSEQLPDNYILFTGTRGGYKNFNKLIEAIYEFLLTNDLYLICAGGGNFTSEEISLFKKYKIEKKVLQFSVDDLKLKSLYKHSNFFIFPSLYEGFGIPLLEAMTSNCPILCSNTSCFPEIAGDSALYFNPYSEDDIREKINYALHNDLNEFVRRGKKRLEYFSWNKAREKTINSYKKVLNEY
jgi:glycosyltransferase involved in cell wall biosynthesis